MSPCSACSTSSSVTIHEPRRIEAGVSRCCGDQLRVVEQAAEHDADTQAPQSGS